MKVTVAIILAWIAVIIAALYTSIAGIIMCFKASVLIGVVSLFVQGAGGAEAIVYWVSGYDIAQHLALALGLGV